MEKDDKTKFIDTKNQKTIIIDKDDIDKERNDQSQKTIIINKDKINQNQRTIVIDKDEIEKARTTVMYSIDGITPKIEQEDDAEKIDTKEQSKILKNLFPGKTKAEQLKINRNFLRDVVPFKLERLIDDIKSTPEGLSTGFNSLDQFINIPQSAITLIASKSKQEKTIFMLNMLLNMTKKYNKKHFLFYTYEEPKIEIETLMINISGVKHFSDMKGSGTNLNRWKYELKNKNIQILKEKLNTDIEYIGLKNFLKISNRIHIIDSSYNIYDLIDSIKSFDITFNMGAIFIDYFQKIRPESNMSKFSRDLQLQDISSRLKNLINKMKFPLISGVQLKIEKNITSEYDFLSLRHLKELGGFEQEASLIIGLQNYSKSKFIGSNINDQFNSKFYSHPIKKAETMPQYFRDKKPETIILAKVLENRDGPEPEVELPLNKKLLKISDLTVEHINKIKKESK